jgi:hypothetical protein
MQQAQVDYDSIEADIAAHIPGPSMLSTWLQTLCGLRDDLDVMLQWLEGTQTLLAPQQQDTARAPLDQRLFKMAQRQQRERLHAFGLQSNALVSVRGNPERGGLLLVNTSSVPLSPTELPFVLILAEAMLEYQTLSSPPQCSLGFVQKNVLAVRALELTRGIRTTFNPAPEVVKIYIGRIRRKLAHLGMGNLIETHPRLGWRLSTLPEQIEIVRDPD